MRRSVLAIAAAGSMFAITAAAASTSLSATGATMYKAASGSQTVTWNQCSASSFSVAYTTETDPASADVGKVTGVTVTLNGASAADLANCNVVAISLDGGTTFGDPETLPAASGADTTYTRVMSSAQTVTATDSVTSLKIVVTQA